MGGLFSRKKKQDAKRSESSGSVWVGSRDLGDEAAAGAKTDTTAAPPASPAPAPKIECPYGCVPDPNYVPPPQDPTQDQGGEPRPKPPVTEKPCLGKKHVPLPPGTDEEPEEVIPAEKEPLYGTGPYKPEPPPVFETDGKDDKKKKEKGQKPDACEIKDFESAAKIKRKKGVDPCNPEAEEEKKKAAKAVKDAKARMKDEPKGPTGSQASAVIDTNKDKATEQGAKPCPDPSPPTPPPTPKDPKQEAKEKKERERKAKEEEKKRLEEEKKKKEAEKKRLEEEKKAQEKEKKRLEEERKAKEKAEKEKAAREAKEAKEKAAREAKEAKEKAAREQKEKKEAEAAKKKKEEEEKKLEKKPSDSAAVKPSGDTAPQEPSAPPPVTCPPGCMPDPALAPAKPPPPPPSSSEPEMRDPNATTTAQKVNEIECPPGCMKDPNIAVRTQEPQMGGAAPPPKPPQPTPPPPMPADPCVWNYPQTPCPLPPPPGPHLCPTCRTVAEQCDREWPQGKPTEANKQQLASAYCQRHGYYLNTQNFGTRPSSAYPAHYGYGMPEPVTTTNITPSTFPPSQISSRDPPTHTKAANNDNIILKECPVQRHNAQYHERPHTPYHMPPCTTYLERPGTPCTAGPIAIDASGCCHAPLVTRQVTHFGTRQCQFSANQNDYEGENDHYAQGAIVPLTDQPAAIIAGGTVLYIGGPTDQQPHFRYARQRTPSIRVKHISLPKLPFVSFQGVPLDNVQPFYNDPLQRDDTIRLVIKRKKHQNLQQGNSLVRDTQRNYSVMPGDVKNANFAIKSSDDFETEGLDGLEYRRLMRMEDDGMITIHSQEITKRNISANEKSEATKNNDLRGKPKFVNFNVVDGEKPDTGSGVDKKTPQQEVVVLDNEEDCDDEVEDLVYDEDDDLPECDEDQAEDLMFQIESTGEDDTGEVWIEEDDGSPEAEENDGCDDEEEEEAAWSKTPVQPPFVRHDQSFKFEPFDEPNTEPTTLENREPGAFDVMDLSSIVSRMTEGVEFEPSDTSVVADDGDPTVEIPQTSNTPRTIPPMSDSVSTANGEKVPSIIKFGSWVKNAILPDYKK